MARHGVQGQLLDINILGCRNLRDKEWISRQDPYVVIHYASSKFRTKTDTDGGRNPSFNQKFVLPLIEGLREVNVEVWNSNTLQFDDFIGSGRIMLEKALTAGYDDSTWNLTSKRGKFAGEVRVILHFNKTEKPITAPAYQTPAPAYQTPGYSPTPPQAYQTPGYNPTPPQAYQTPGHNPTPPQAYPYGPPNPNPYQPAPPSSAYYNPQQQQAAPYPAYPPSGPYASQQQYPPPPAPGYGGSYPPTPPAAPSAGYPPVYQEYPYRPY